MFRLTTLGMLRLERDGSPVPVPQPKRVALLAYLALAHPRGLHRRDTLLAMFWPTLPTERARNALRQALHQLRAVCGEGVVVTRGMHEVGIDPAQLWCDVHELEAAAARGDAEAVAEIYGGDLLPGLFAADAGEWEDWLARERIRLRALAADAGRTLAHAAHEAGDAPTVARWARWTCGLDPLDETAVRWAMELLTRCGLRAPALELYERFTMQMRREFDAEPGTDTAALAEAARAASAPSAVPLSAPPRERTGAPAPESSEVDLLTFLSAGAVAPAAEAAATTTGSLANCARLRDAASAPVEERAAGESVDSPPLVPSAGAGARTGVAARKRVRSRRLAFAGVLVLASVAAAAAGLRGHEPPPRRDRVAVLPFRPAGGGSADVALAEETEERVRAALAMSGLDVAAGDVADDPAAGTVVRGTLYRRGPAVEVRATVSDALTGSEVASLSALLPAGDTAAAAALADRVLAAVATRADPVFGWVGPTSRPAGSPGYRPFVEGLRALRDERADDAAAHFRAAAVADSGFALAWLMAAGIDAEQGRLASADSVARWLASRRAELPRADRLILEWLERSVARDRAGALAAMVALTEAAPELEMGHFQAALEAVRCNRPAEALRHLDRIDPQRGLSRGWASYWATRADALHMLRRHADELAHIRRGMARHPELTVLRDYELRALAALGRTAEVARRIDEYAVIPPRGGWHPAVAALHAAAELQAHGHAAAARSAHARAVASARQRAAADSASPQAEVMLAEALFAAGENDEASHLIARFEAERPRCVGCVGARGVLAAHAGDHARARAADADLAARPRGIGVLLWRARITAALGDRAAASTLVREAVARGYAYDGTTHTEPQIGTLFP
ncbi:MAG TPA: BTAD domain-containing putative transcriptional regulator [Longimicrobium sp.]|nr:BTAD domain-containing putative transcriptional regulator [Longimicrobium sp.]